MLTDDGGSGWRLALAASAPVIALAGLAVYGRMPQDEILPGYHLFADRRAIWGVPNFWNVVSNVPFLLVAIWGLRALRSRVAFRESCERTAYRVVLIGLGLIGAGSSYYHWRPDNARLVWDRLPMALVFMALLATTIGERISVRAGRLLLYPLLAAGVVSVLYWRVSDDLRLYVLVQFCAVAGLPLLILLFPPRYSGTAGILTMVMLYGLALAFDHYDRPLAAVAATGGHPWKHAAAALAMLFYVSTVEHRHPAPAPDHASARISF